MLTAPELTPTHFPRNSWRSATATRRRWRSASATPSSTSMPSRCAAGHACRCRLALPGAPGPAWGCGGQCRAGASRGTGAPRSAGPPADLASPRQDYELQLVTFKAQVEPVASPAKKPKVQSASDSIIQEVRGDASVWSRHVAEPGAPSAGAEGCSTGRARGWPQQCGVAGLGSLWCAPLPLTPLSAAVRGPADTIQRADHADQPVHQVHYRDTAAAGGGGGRGTGHGRAGRHDSGCIFSSS